MVKTDDCWREPPISLELHIGLEGLAKLPGDRNHVEGGDGAAIGRLNPEGEALTIEVGQALPIGSPVPRHGLPLVGFGSFNPYVWDVPGSSNVRYKD